MVCGGTVAAAVGKRSCFSTGCCFPSRFEKGAGAGAGGEVRFLFMKSCFLRTWQTVRGSGVAKGRSGGWIGGGVSIGGFERGLSGARLHDASLSLSLSLLRGAKSSSTGWVEGIVLYECMYVHSWSGIDSNQR